MKKNKLIKDSTPVSEIGFGAWQLGQASGWKTVSEAEAIRMVHAALDLGINFFDTAPNYGLGTSEERLGKALQGRDRTSFVLNTKFGHTVTGQTNNTAAYIRESLEGSLRRLQVDYVDSFLFHSPPIEYLDGRKNDHYEILEQLKAEGKIRAYGASLDTAEQIRRLTETTETKVVEAFFNILHQDVASTFDALTRKGVKVIAKIPFDSGWLTGKYHAQSTFEGIRSRWSTADIATRADLVAKVKKRIGPEWSLSQAALAFCLAHEAVATVIPGATNLQQLQENRKASDRKMSKELLARLEQFYQEEVRDKHLPW
ncbi:MAG: aldo/keto reductase [Bacteroidota bacterium]